jgi:hypothetical protein
MAMDLAERVQVFPAVWRNSTSELREGQDSRPCEKRWKGSVGLL